MANCIKCKAALPDGALFCPMCGKKQASVDRKATKRGNGTGTVYKRGSSWVAEITKGYREEDGKLTRVKAKKCGFRTKREALEYIPMLRHFAIKVYEKPGLAHRASAIPEPFAKLCVVRLVCICSFEYRAIIFMVVI
jgi:uncharacterized Zn finger protein (UPF0148 family)